jgi:UDP-N-acetylglucosamine acyltransferase
VTERGSANAIHPTALLEGEIELGAGNVIGPYCVLHGPLTLGDENRIGPHAVIGTRGDEVWQRRYDTTGKRIEIGSRCTLREHVTVHKPCYGELTRIGDDVYAMHGAYIAHDTRVEDRAIIAQNAAIGGVSRILEGGYLAMGAILHQEAVLGHYAIVAAAGAAVKCVRPFSRHVPGQPITVNAYAIERYGFAEHKAEIERYVLDGSSPVSERLRAMVAEYEALRDAGGRGEYR